MDFYSRECLGNNKITFNFIKSSFYDFLFVAFDTRLNKNKIYFCPRKYTQHNYHL